MAGDAPTGSGAPHEPWNEAVLAHLALAVRVYPLARIQQVMQTCALTLGPGGTNDARAYDDVVRYFEAVCTVLGDTALLSAKMTVMNRARSLGLRAPEGWQGYLSTRLT